MWGVQPVKELLYQQHITQKAVAEALGVTPPNVTLTLNGHVLPSLRTAAIIARIAGVPIEEAWVPAMLGLEPIPS